MARYRYEEILKRLEGLDQWLSEMGVKAVANDRVHQALDVMRMAEAASRRGRETGEYTNINSRDLFPIIEALEVFEVFCAFEKEKSRPLSETLRRALSGPAHPIHENTQNRDGRNMWFELALAAEWRSRGAQVELGEPDLHLSWEDKRFLVACKRPYREESIRANVRTAISQLNENLKSESKDSFGVIAISLSKVLNPGDKVLDGGPEALDSILARLLEEHKSDWHSAETDSRICAVLFHAVTPADTGNDVDISRVTYTLATEVKEITDGTKAFAEFAREINERLRE